MQILLAELEKILLNASEREIRLILAYARGLTRHTQKDQQ